MMNWVEENQQKSQNESQHESQHVVKKGNRQDWVERGLSAFVDFLGY
jgi:hypothetical protein